MVPSSAAKTDQHPAGDGGHPGAAAIASPGVRLTPGWYVPRGVGRAADRYGPAHEVPPGVYRPGAGYTSAGKGMASTMTPMIMHGLLDLLAHAWLTPLTTAVSPGWSSVASVSVTR
jgi:hypothetical protein